MDPTLIAEFAKGGIPLLGAVLIIIALWNKLGKREDENKEQGQKITEQYYASKASNENLLNVLVVLKDEIKSLRATLDDFIRRG